MASREHPVERRAARVVLLDPQDRVLLFASAMPDRRPGLLWLPPGGALEAGEDWVDAAVRELREETGLTLPLGPRVWIRHHLWYWGDRAAWFLAIEHFFFVRTHTTDVVTTGWTEDERRAVSYCPTSRRAGCRSYR